MKALVIAPQPFFSPRGTPMSVYYRTLVTAELGVDIDLLTYGIGMDVEIPRTRIIRTPRIPFMGSVRTGPSVRKFFLDIILFVWTFFLLLKNRYQFVHAHEEAVFWCRFLKPLFRFKLVYDMHSCLPQQLTNFNFTESKILIDIFKKLEDGALKKADATITICPDLTEYVQQQDHGCHRLVQIENSIFEPVKLRVAESSNGKPPGEEKPLDLPGERRLVVYAGTLEAYQGIDILIRSFAHVLNEQKDAFLLIVGGDKSQVSKYKNLAHNTGIGDHVLFTGLVSQSLAKYYSGKASVLVSPRSDGTNTPLKIYEQIASGIPLVATNIYSHTQVLDPTTAFLVDPVPEDLARGILEALDPDGRRGEISGNAKKLYESRYARDVYTEKLRQVIELLSPESLDEEQKG